MKNPSEISGLNADRPQADMVFIRIIFTCLVAE
jgi:hypothetical protein